jgi:DNA-binding XRE family transcriptional regulator
MILNLRDLSIAEARICMLQARCDFLDKRVADPHQAIYAKVEREKRIARIAELKAQLKLYHQLSFRRSVPIDWLYLTSIQKLPEQLIKRRIFVQLTQAELAKELGIPRQTIARYERSRYSCTSLKRIIQIDTVLRIFEAKIIKEEKIKKT